MGMGSIEFGNSWSENNSLTAYAENAKKLEDDDGKGSALPPRGNRLGQVRARMASIQQRLVQTDADKHNGQSNSKLITPLKARLNAMVTDLQDQSAHATPPHRTTFELDDKHSTVTLKPVQPIQSISAEVTSAIHHAVHQASQGPLLALNQAERFKPTLTLVPARIQPGRTLLKEKAREKPDHAVSKDVSSVKSSALSMPYPLMMASEAEGPQVMSPLYKGVHGVMGVFNNIMPPVVAVDHFISNAIRYAATEAVRGVHTLCNINENTQQVCRVTKNTAVETWNAAKDLVPDNSFMDWYTFVKKKVPPVGRILKKTLVEGGIPEAEVALTSQNLGALGRVSSVAVPTVAGARWISKVGKAAGQVRTLELTPGKTAVGKAADKVGEVVGEAISVSEAAAAKATSLTTFLPPAVKILASTAATRTTSPEAARIAAALAKWIRTEAERPHLQLANRSSVVMSYPPDHLFPSPLKRISMVKISGMEIEAALLHDLSGSISALCPSIEVTAEVTTSKAIQTTANKAVQTLQASPRGLIPMSAEEKKLRKQISNRESHKRKAQRKKETKAENTRVEEGHVTELLFNHFIIEEDPKLKKYFGKQLHLIENEDRVVSQVGNHNISLKYYNVHEKSGILFHYHWELDNVIKANGISVPLSDIERAKHVLLGMIELSEQKEWIWSWKPEVIYIRYRSSRASFATAIAENPKILSNRGWEITGVTIKKLDYDIPYVIVEISRQGLGRQTLPRSSSALAIAKARREPMQSQDLMRIQEGLKHQFTNGLMDLEKIHVADLLTLYPKATSIEPVFAKYSGVPSDLYKSGFSRMQGLCEAEGNTVPYDYLFLKEKNTALFSYSDKLGMIEGIQNHVDKIQKAHQLLNNIMWLARQHNWEIICVEWELEQLHIATALIENAEILSLEGYAIEAFTENNGRAFIQLRK